MGRTSGRTCCRLRTPVSLLANSMLFMISLPFTLRRTEFPRSLFKIWTPTSLARSQWMGRWVKYRQALTQTTTQKNSASSSRAPSPTMNTTSTTTASNKRNLLSQSNYTDPKSSEMNSIASKCSCPPTTDPRFQ